ncbi:hypothetical protein GQ57_20665 [Burkholderia sp. MSh2]|uniref:Crp/Fnr family transcriptional regulator n=1 Tax=Burkholderia paludis TaxID=1506587 RepID=A0A6J5DIP7_9BURK|nr:MULTISPECIES: Crp/Fnr family transcriptional regulator [Burkholderia]KEZ04097.1 hypothetical protein GQ57_20665 [Burkholderia sp. MSh2]KFG98123.1 hypothetical protein GQ56_0105555 [Burkholderia paludis]CAB3753111.1 CRP-like cAMP-activated global transcriptional regulator [Burkholderia paludis]VWB65495.1 Crp/Fnr family transcriptional regulator [Burkholderia paludis]
MTRTGFNWIADLSPVARDALLARAHDRMLPNATVLYCQGDTTTELFQIVSGEVRMFVLDEDGQEVLIYFYGPGDVVADSSAIDPNPYPVTIMTRGETRLKAWSIDDVAELRAAFPEIDTSLALQMSQRLRGLLVLILELVTLSVPARVAARIASLAQLQGKSATGTPLSLSQTDLSLMVGATRQSINSVLNDLKGRDLIDTHYGRIYVKDLSGLSRYAAAVKRKA